MSNILKTDRSHKSKENLICKTAENNMQRSGSNQNMKLSSDLMGGSFRIEVLQLEESPLKEPLRIQKINSQDLNVNLNLAES